MGMARIGVVPTVTLVVRHRARSAWIGAAVGASTRTTAARRTATPTTRRAGAVEQVAAWYQSREKLGLDTIWPHAGTYEKFQQLALLLSVQATLKRYERWTA